MKPLRLGGLLVLSLLLLALAASPEAPTVAAAGSVNLVAIDADRTNGPPSGGNLPNDIGPIDRCISVAGGATVVVDVVIQGVPPYDSESGTGGIRGAGLDILYDNLFVRVIGSDSGSNTGLHFSTAPWHPYSVEEIDHHVEPTYDLDEHYRIDTADLATTNIESGEGLLSKITFRATNSGLSGISLLRLTDLAGETDLSPSVPRVYSGDRTPYTIDTVQDAFIAVGQPCPSNLIDVDGDTIINEDDNCPLTRNGPTQASTPGTGDQTDADGDGFGDACEDRDRDSETPFNPHSCQGICPGGAFRDSIETIIGTNPVRRCAATSSANDEAGMDAWPLDFNDDQKANTVDVGTFVPLLNKSAPGPPYNVRHDLNANGTINSVDVGLFVVSLNQNCGFIADQFDACPKSGGDPVDANGCEDVQVDWDGDGVCDPRAPSGGPAGCTGVDNCPRVPNASQADMDADGKGDACDPEGPGPNTDGVGGADDCVDGVDNDGDGQTDMGDSLCSLGDDSDSDMFEDGFEIFLGTNPNDPCADTSTGNDEGPPDAWPPDFFDNQFHDTLDVGSYSSYMSPVPGGVGLPYSVRRDLFPDGVIGMVDTFYFRAAYLSTCTGF